MKLFSWFKQELHLDTILSDFYVVYDKLHDFVDHKQSLIDANNAKAKDLQTENTQHAASVEQASKAISGLKNILG